ncbi:MAG: NUDIX pyrophosphatase [Candidatus Woesearchaeota archaeon]
MRLPIQTQIYIYRKAENKIEFLLLKRISSRGGFWQGITGGLDEGESIKECALREVAEETGITGVENIFGPYYVFQFEDEGFYNSTAKDKNLDMSTIPINKFVVSEYVFAIEVDENTNIDLNNNIYQEHEEFKWCTFEEALSLLKYDSGKQALKILNEKLNKE